MKILYAFLRSHYLRAGHTGLNIIIETKKCKRFFSFAYNFTDFLFGDILTTWLDPRVMGSSKIDNSFAVPRLIGSIVAVASLYIKSDATDKREKRASHTLQSMLLGFITCFSIG